MQRQLYLSWAWCNRCNDGLVHKRYEKLRELRCPTCLQLVKVSAVTLIPDKPVDLMSIIPEGIRDQIIMAKISGNSRY
jgi:hypothetical protein